VPAALAIQIGILFLLGPNFTPFMVCYVFWVPWDRVLCQRSASS